MVAQHKYPSPAANNLGNPLLFVCCMVNGEWLMDSVCITTRRCKFILCVCEKMQTMYRSGTYPDVEKCLQHWPKNNLQCRAVT